MLLESPFAYGGDWAFADRVGDVEGWVSHSPLTRPSLAPAFASFVNLVASSEDLSRMVATSNNTLALFPELTTPDWDRRWALPFVVSWGGPGSASRWELFGPTDPALADIADPEIWRPALADGGTRVASLTRIFNGIAGVRGLAGPGDPTGTGFGDLVGGRSIYLAVTPGVPADSFEGRAHVSWRTSAVEWRAWIGRCCRP
jgi:hypothetical protein